jgi:signal transduction histidine kinase
MQTVGLLIKIRQVWIDRISHRLARGEGVRESFIHELGHFYDLLQQAIATGDPSWLDPLLDAWVDARTKSELEKQEASLTPILNQIILSTYEVVGENLEVKDALDVLGSLLPIYIHALDRTAQREARLHIEHISKELDNVRLTLEKLDKNKSDFIAVAAHELKTPLTLIEGYSAMLRDQFPLFDQSSQATILINGINNGTRRLREIIDDMIDVSLIFNQSGSINYWQ